MKTIHFSDSIKTKIQSLQFGLIEANGVKVGPAGEGFETELEKLIAELKEKFANKAPSEDLIVSAIRRMYREVGWEPTKYRPSSEALIRRLIQGKGLYSINNLVDYGNLVSARFHVPMGLYDLDKVQGDIFIDTGKEGESYAGISKPQIRATGKIILRDDLGVFGNPTADSARTSIREDTKHVLAVFFCPATLQTSYIKETIQQLASFYTRFTTEQNVTTHIQIVE
ncbi:MAG: hypothetical protein D8M58_05830 [Calditrichaeota bacterium]|nr:MAG: hypothetical protein DWQ03_20675 [Calditrichota bacterium]MBL1204897.1 hypothetical protein [Calditrichota bacterium]NOG44726.1 hypothetical protein [Calditrichota bacterium]